MPPAQMYTVQGEGLEPVWKTRYCDGEDCEWLSAYNPGGLCPVVIGDVLSGPDILHDGEVCSFEVMGKLGHGSYSTVWLGWNSQREEFGALKVVTHKYSTSDNAEMRILNKLGKLEYAFFHTHKPTEREFLCLVTKPRGCTLRGRVNAYIDVPLDVPSITAFVVTLVTKLLDMHDKGIQHGDISPGNVAMAAQDYAFCEEGLQEAFGDDVKSYLEVFQETREQNLPPRPPNLPEYIVIPWGELCTDVFDMSQVDFLDFGSAYDTPSKKGVKGTTMYCAPELDRDSENIATAKSDLWSLGCVIVYGLSGEHLLWLLDNEQKYFKGDYETQISVIESRLRYHRLLKRNPKYMNIIAQIIQALVRIDPTERDPDRARQLVKELERCGEEVEFPHMDSLQLS